MTPTEVATRYLEMFNSGDISASAEIVSPAITFRLGGIELPPGIPTIERRISAVHAGVSNASLTIERIVEQGDTAAVRYRVEGRHTGTLQLPGAELPATNANFSYAGAAFLTVENGKVTSEDSVANLVEVLRRLATTER